MTIHPQLPNDGFTPWCDVENILVTLIDSFAKKITPPGWACVVPPVETETKLNDGVPIIQVRRTGGTLTRVLDTVRIDLAVTCAYRSDAWRVMGWLLAQLFEFTGVVETPSGERATVVEITDGTGTRQRPALTQDSRTVQTMLQVTVRKPRDS